MRRAGNAPAFPVWKTGVLLLDQRRGSTIPENGDAGRIRTCVRRVAAACLTSRPRRRSNRKAGGINRTCTGTAAFTEPNADGYTMIPVTKNGSPGRYCPRFRGLKDRCITLMLQRKKVASPPGFAPDPAPSQSAMLLLHHGDSFQRKWRPMPVTLRRDLFDRQAGCYYLNGALMLEMVGGRSRHCTGLSSASRTR